MNATPETPELETYPSKQILSAHRHICLWFKRPDFPLPDIAFKKTFLSAIVSANKAAGDSFDKEHIPWEEFLSREVNWACLNKKTPEEAWDYISNRVFTPKVIDQYQGPEKKGLWDTTPRKTNHQDTPAREISPRPIVDHGRKTTKRGQTWRRQTCWEKLWPSSRATFFTLCLRATWPERPQGFPWAYAGVGKWTKGRGYTLGSLPRATGYSVPQCQRALRQLQGYGLIARITRGRPTHTQDGKKINGYTGVSKYQVFFTPEMSAAFYAITKNKNRIQKPKRLN